jgi:hypothetical protein
MLAAIGEEPPLVEHHALVDAWTIKNQWKWLTKPRGHVVTKYDDDGTPEGRFVSATFISPKDV